MRILVIIGGVVLLLAQAALVCVAAIAFYGAVPFGAEVNGEPVPIHQKVIIIDPGHGGRDKGASGKHGVYERDIVLSISQYIKEELETHGMRAVLTREGEASLADPDADNQKRDDMKKRVEIIKQERPDLVISIHLNNFVRDPSVHGIQCFYDDDSDQSFIYADHIQKHLNKNLDNDRRAMRGDYFILETEFPGVLIECGFLSNPDEEAKLSTTEYQKELAQLITQAVEEILEKGSDF
ncbi:MAG: N-acetylmuramoyl-L-alanine amidase [Firmicutes bacterium]|nr:N-acetylmuramoyl-L-alanine amidase [Bacillota bacterium]